MAQGEVLEGFLCPLCMKDLGDVIQLQIHFDEAHSKEDQAFVQSLKDLFGKAKRILADEDSSPGTSAENQVSAPKLKLAPREDDQCHPVSGIRRDLYQELPSSQLSSQSHFADFKKIRSSRVDRYATETNRLIVRLDKLLENIPGDASKRRDHEKLIVTWIDEDLVKLCPTCAKSFNIARRKHHCRLCGSVMCQDCSQFVDFNFCRKLINPSNLSSYKKIERQGWSVNGGRNSLDTRSMGSPSTRSTGLFKLRRSGSRESIGSAMIGSMIPEGRVKEEFRCCSYCKILLSHRDTQMDLATSEPIISQFYVKLREYVQMGEEMSPQYISMYDSLMVGETTYHSSDVKMLRVKLLKVAENIDLMSKKIQALGSENLPEGIAKPRRFVLQDHVRRSAVNFIKETLVGLPSLPSDEELVKIQERRKEDIAKKIAEERKRAEEARAKFQNLQEKRRTEISKLRRSPSESGSGSKFNKSSVSYESGFVLSSSAQQREIVSVVSDDPMLQQIQIITGYIAQARQQNRFDEVNMLETNLRMLQEEFRKQSINQENEPSENKDYTENQESSSYVSFKTSSSRSSDMNNGVNDAASNPFNSDSDDEYDASGKNPFAE